MTLYRNLDPTLLAPSDGSGFGIDSTGQEAVSYQDGSVAIRNWSEYDRRTFSWPLIRMMSDTDRLEAWRRLLKQIRMRTLPFYLLDPIPAAHDEVVCGAVGDGTRTTFALPVAAAASELPFIGGVPQTTGYTLHSAANLLDADSAALDSDAGIWTLDTNGAVVRDEKLAAIGLASLRMTPDSSPTSAWVTQATTLYVACSASQKYTFGMWKRGLHSCRVTIKQFESDKTTPAGADVSSTPTGTDDGSAWVETTGTITTGASAAYLAIVLYALTPADNSPVWFDAVYLNPGDYPHFHHPSCCPSLIEFSSGVASGARVTASATGKWCGPVRLENSSSNWQVMSPGSAKGAKVIATEEIL